PEDGSTVIQTDELNIASSFEDVVLPDEFNGSNNWVVDGYKTASGKPLLADDPHLGLSTPSIWYEMSLQSNDINVAGVILDRKSTRLNSSHVSISYAVFCLKKKSSRKQGRVSVVR